MFEIDQYYQSALDFLYSFVDYSLTRQLRYAPDKFDLERMRALMRLMGDPQNSYPIVHVAGTKGKGSTAAMIVSVLREAGYRTGFYTSPHLQDFTERIQIDFNPISHQTLVSEVEEIKPLLRQIPEITTFEITTAIAFNVFKKENVEQ